MELPVANPYTNSGLAKIKVINTKTTLYKQNAIQMDIDVKFTISDLSHIIQSYKMFTTSLPNDRKTSMTASAAPSFAIVGCSFILPSVRCSEVFDRASYNI